MNHIDTMKLALNYLEGLTRALKMDDTAHAYQVIAALREALAEQPAQQEPVALKWQQSPIRTAWGDDMVVASVAIDNDHTLSLYCERDQTPKVDAMFAQRTWVGLTDEEILAANYPDGEENGPTISAPDFELDCFAKQVEAKLKEKNT